MPKGIFKHKKGYRHSEETKRKIGLANSVALKGRKLSEAVKLKISLTQKGKSKPWLKDRKLSEEHKRNISNAEKGNKHWNYGKHWSKENKEKLSIAHIGISNGPHREETKQKMREKRILNPNRKFKDTTIELKIEAELEKRNINYQKQIPLCKIAIVDFYLPEYRIVIQCDGDYWHNRPCSKERDERQDRVLTFNGFNVYRFWEHEINESSEECINKIIFIKQ
jgi:very-short-patch-repair endonuclease